MYTWIPFWLVHYRGRFESLCPILSFRLGLSLKNVQNLIFLHHLFVWHIVLWVGIPPTLLFPRIRVTLVGILMFFVLFWFLFVLPPWSFITLVFTVTWVTVAMFVFFLWLSRLFPARGFWYITFRITLRVRLVFLVFFGLFLLYWRPWSWPVCTMNCLALILIVHYRYLSITYDQTCINPCKLYTGSLCVHQSLIDSFLW